MDGKVIAPQIVDQLVRRYRPPDVEDEVGQQRADLGLGNRDRPAVVRPYRQGPEHAETHQVRIARDPRAAAGHPQAAQAPPAADRQRADRRPPQDGVCAADAGER
jgi:hypothetical protein